MAGATTETRHHGAVEDPTELRAEVRALVSEWHRQARLVPRCDAWLRGHDAAFSRELANRGLIGMTWPRDAGGQERSNLARMVVTEELLRAGAPVAGHWMADRQIGPAILRHGSVDLQKTFLPRIAAGEVTFCIGLSEPEAGSDLASVRTVATPSEGGWRLRGRKVWTSHAHRSSHAYVLARTDSNAGKHEGLTEFIVDMDADGVVVSPIHDLGGEHHFNEVVFDDVFVPADRVVGIVGNGWQQVTEQLAFERGGMERVLSTYPLLESVLAEAARTEKYSPRLGEALARIATLRQMAYEIAIAMDAGEAPILRAAMLKDLGTASELAVNDIARAVLGVEPDPLAPGDAGLLAEGILAAPGFTVRGGSTEILRSIIAKDVLRRPKWTGGEASQLRSIADDVLGGGGRGPLCEYVGLPPMWSTVTELGWPGVGLPEDLGGSGGDLAELAVLVEACGRNAASMPLAETAWAKRVLSDAGFAPPKGAATVVLPRAGEHLAVEYDILSGTATRVPWGAAAEHLVVFAHDAGGPSAVLCIPGDTRGVRREPGSNLADEPRDTVHFDQVVITDEHRAGLIPRRRSAAAFGALMRAVSIVGALETVLNHTMQHIMTREQFGRPLQSFQAVATLIAGMAEQVVLARTAVATAIAASKDELDIDRVAAAMVVASAAATEVARGAHQLHGAIGVTREHPLQLGTRRLWSWRDECGGQRYWARLLAERLLPLGPDEIWDWLTAEHPERPEVPQC